MKAKSQWSDRIKTIEKPLLRSYVFVKASEDQRTAIRLTEGVINFVYRSGKPLLVKEKVIQEIVRFQLEHETIEAVVFPRRSETENDGYSVDSLKAPSAGILPLEALSVVLVALPIPAHCIDATLDKT